VIDGNGGELIGNEHNPWFTGTTPTPYCLSVSPDFSLPKATASQQIASVFAAWKKVFTTLNVMNSSSDYQILNGNGTLSVALDFAEVDCSSNPSLVFKLGIHDNSVDAALNYAAAKTVGFALRTSYNDTTGASQGFVWLVPDTGSKQYQGPQVAASFWSQPHIFRDVVMHEIGHVLGLQHIPNTIMDATAPALIVEHGLNADWQGEDFLNSAALDSPYCGTVPFAADPSQATILSGLWNLTPNGLTICLTPRNDLIGSDQNTPTLIEFKKNGAVVASQRVSIAGVWENTATVAGNYLQRSQASSPYAFTTTTFLYTNSSGLARGSYVKTDGTTQFIEFDMPAPGFVLLRVPYQTEWSAVGVYASPNEATLEALNNLLGSQ
jgi:hypothetical protein